jgi:hypothetical protein
MHSLVLDIEKACEATKCHELLTARIIRFCERAKDELGLETDDVHSDGSIVRFEMDWKANLKRGISTYSIGIEPGARRTAIRLNKLRPLTGKASRGFVFHIYDSVKTWPHPTNEAFAELLEVIRGWL